MTKIKGFAQTHKKLIAIVLVLVFAGGIALVLLGSGRPAQAADMPATTTLVQGELVQTVAANGTLQSANAKDVNSTLSYKITEVLVKVGDVVEEGQPLVVLDTSDLEKSIADTRKSLSDARAKDALQVQQAQRKLDEATETRSFNLAKNDAAIATAANTLNSASNTLANANSKLNEANNRISAAAANVQTCTQALQQEEAKRDSWPAPGDPTDANPYIATVQTATDNLTAAEAELAAAQQAVPTLQQEQASASTAAASAQTAYDNAVSTRDTAYRNDSISIENARDNLNTAKLNNTAQTYQTQLDGYLKQKEEAVIEAPISGTVTAASAQVGSAPGGAAGASTGALFTIEDTTKLEVPAYVPEYDTVQLKVGMQVEVATDAISGETWQGSVQSISPTAADTNGNFLVTVGITSTLGELAGGMSAKLNILVESKPDVYAVPYDAVVADESGALVVYVLDETSESASGSTEAVRRAVPVETGMETDYYIEIISDELEDGMQVVNDPTGKNVSADTTGTGGLFGR